MLVITGVAILLAMVAFGARLSAARRAIGQSDELSRSV
jgi:HAMP domain-containing protein